MGHVLGSSRIRSRGEVTLPKDVMERLKVQSNDEILWIHEDENNRIIVVKAQRVNPPFDYFVGFMSVCVVGGVGVRV